VEMSSTRMSESGPLIGSCLKTKSQVVCVE
jgi:hypothetical protein